MCHSHAKLHKQFTLIRLLQRLHYKQPISNDDQIFKILKQYSEAHFFLYRFGIISAQDSNQFNLYIYRPLDRNQDESQRKAKLFYDAKKDALVCQENLYKLLILKENTQSPEPLFIPIDLKKSIIYKKEMRAYASNPYYHEHFIYVSLIPRWNKAEKFQMLISKLRKEFNHDFPYTFDAFSLINPDKDLSKFKEEILLKKLKDKLMQGRIYLILDAHGYQGKPTLMSELEDDKGITEEFIWEIPKILEILKLLEIPPTAEIDIDLFACSTAMPTKEHPSFIQSFKDALVIAGFNHVSIIGNFDEVYDHRARAPYMYLARQLPDKVAICGELREPLTSREKFKNSEYYLRIMELSDTLDPIYNKASNLLKSRAIELSQQCKTPMDFDRAYIELHHHYDQYKAWEKLIIKISDDFPFTPRNVCARERCVALLRKLMTSVESLEDLSVVYKKLENHYFAFKNLDNLAQQIKELYAQEKNTRERPKMHKFVLDVNLAYIHSATSGEFAKEFQTLKTAYDAYQLSKKYNVEHKKRCFSMR